MTANKTGRRLGSSLLLVHLLVIGGNGQQSPPATDGHQAAKIGLAPHDRPACQLPPIGAQRRHLSPIGASSLNNELQLAENASTTTSLLLNSPSLVSTQPTMTKRNQPVSQVTRKQFDSTERLRQLRQLLVANQYDAYLVTPNDEHGSEYVTDYDRRLRFISGFTGSNGYALVLLDRAVLFTDGRYALQADQDLDCNWWLVVGDEPLTDIHQWLRANAANSIKVATDARLMPLQSFDYLEAHLRRLESEFALISQDLVDVVWNNQVLDGTSSAGRLQSQGQLFVHPLQFAGNQSWQEKLVRLADSMAELQARHYIVSQLDDIAWLLNLRGADIPMSPLFKAYLLISRQPSETLAVEPAKPKPSSAGEIGLQSPQVLQVQASQSIKLTLYVDMKKVNQLVRDHLQVDNGSVVVGQRSKAGDPSATRCQVELKDYEVFIMDIRDKLSRQLQGKLLLNAAANVAIHVLAKQYEDRLVLTESLIQRLKAVKTDGEVNGMRLAHWRDSLAISMLLAQLELDIGQRGLVNRWSEVSAAAELEFYRSLMDHNRGQSFDTISAYGPNAAVVHYKPSEESAGRRVFIGNQSTYLLDSGGQYLDGTTDITRTTHYGQPSELQRETYTRVLMGAIDMMSLVFEQPDGRSPPFRLNDMIARRHLFEIGLDYKHGTGHGIGLYSLVHEAPALIEHLTTVASQRQAAGGAGRPSQSPPTHSDPVPLQPNMFTSVEPGYYKANEFGIRLENIVVTQRAAALTRPNDRQPAPSPDAARFLCFEPVSLVPLEPKLMKLELLSNKQKAWLNSYNLMVRLRLTQQINHYLSRLRNLNTSGQPIQVQGIVSSSRIYQHLASDTNRTQIDAPSQIQLGQYNFMRLDGPAFQEKLEMTHRWILAKTELIALDVPQSMMANQPARSGSLLGRAGAQRSDQSKEQQLDAQRLLLAYMSSAPFNDADSGELMSQLAARAPANSTAANRTLEGGCSGRYECDLLLLDALSPTAQLAAARARRLTSSAQRSLASDAGYELEEPAEGWLPDLFQLGGPSRTSFPLSGWSLMGIGALVLVQLAVTTYMCREKMHKRPTRRRQVVEVQATTSSARRPVELVTESL